MMVVYYGEAWANKRMVLTLPARGSFRIRARYTGLGGGSNPVLPVRTRAGRTCEALAQSQSAYTGH